MSDQPRNPRIVEAERILRNAAKPTVDGPFVFHDSRAVAALAYAQLQATLAVHEALTDLAAALREGA